MIFSLTQKVGVGVLARKLWIMGLKKNRIPSVRVPNESLRYHGEEK